MFKFVRKQTKADTEILQFFRNILGFKPKNISLYKLALIHKSVSKQFHAKNGKLNNERLEYLGDAILSAIVADFLFRKYPFQGEGFLTEMRSKIVSRSNLNKLSQKIGLPILIQHNKDSHSVFNSMDGDAFEALIGAIYLERGYNFTKKIVLNRIIQMYMNIDELETSDWNFKSKLIDWGQKERKKISFEVTEVLTVGNRKQYTSQVFINGEPHEKGINYSIKAAEQLAAEKTYKTLFPPDNADNQ